MVITRLWGGLGNQMFQYAAGLAASRAVGTDLLLDPTQCVLDRNRPYELKHFRISGRLWDDEERRWAERMIRLSRPVDGTTRGLNRCLKRIIAPAVSRRFRYVEDKHNGFQSEVLSSKQRHLYLAGTWASERYTDTVDNAIREEFRFIEPPDQQNQRILEQIKSSAAICVHVRRGDYVSVADTNTRFGLCGLDYYRRAFEFLESRIKGAVAFVFSDDPDWTQQHLMLPCPTVYVRHNVGTRNYEDLRLMSACRHFIIANSTFSWWAAWLGVDAGKIVVAPKVWRLDAQGIADPVPDRWIRL